MDRGWPKGQCIWWEVGTGRREGRGAKIRKPCVVCVLSKAVIQERQ